MTVHSDGTGRRIRGGIVMMVGKRFSAAWCCVLLVLAPAVPAGASGGTGGSGGGGQTLMNAALGLRAAIRHAEFAAAADDVTVARHHLMHVVNCLVDVSNPHHVSPPTIGQRKMTVDCTLLEYPSATNPTTPAPYPAALPLLQSMVQPSPGVRPVNPVNAFNDASAALQVATAALNLPHPSLAKLHTQANAVLRHLLAARAALG